MIQNGRETIQKTGNVLNRTTKQKINDVVLSLHYKDDDTLIEEYYTTTGWIFEPDLSNVVGVLSKYWNIIGDSIEEMTQVEKDVVDSNEQIFQDPIEDMNVRKNKLAKLINAMELNPLIDASVGMGLLRIESEFVESYKYSQLGYSDLMTELTARSIDTNDLYYTFLNTATNSPDDGINVLMAIGGLLQ